VKAVKGFAAFWYDFIVGDDWVVAMGVVIALAGTAGLARAGVPTWALWPCAVAAVLGYSLLRAGRGRAPAAAPARTPTGGPEHPGGPPGR